MGKKILWWINIGMACLLGLSMAAPYVNPEDMSWVGLFGLFFLVFTAINFLFVIIWLMLADRRIIMSLIGLVLSGVFISKYVGIKDRPMPAEGSKPIMLTSFNIQNGLEGYDRNIEIRKQKRERLTAFLADQSTSQILCIQELAEFGKEVLHDAFPTHKIVTTKDKGAAILTTFPSVANGILEFGTRTNSCVWADLETPSGIIRVYSIHLQSNQITVDAEEIIDDIMVEDSSTTKPHESSNKKWKGIFTIFNKIRHGQIHRSRQVDMIKQHVSQSPYPVVLAGDFNDTPMSYTYHTLADSFKDSFVEAGRGLGTTYRGRIPFLRIDYIMADGRLSFLVHTVDKSPVSDHYPVTAEVVLRP